MATAAALQVQSDRLVPDSTGLYRGFLTQRPVHLSSHFVTLALATDAIR